VFHRLESNRGCDSFVELVASWSFYLSMCRWIVYDLFPGTSLVDPGERRVSDLTFSLFVSL